MIVSAPHVSKKKKIVASNYQNIALFLQFYWLPLGIIA